MAIVSQPLLSQLTSSHVDMSISTP